MRLLVTALLVILAGCAPKNFPATPAVPSSNNSFIDLQPGWRLRAIVPLTKSGSIQAPPPVVTAQDGLALTVKANPDLIGYETQYYAVRKNWPNLQIAFSSATDTKDDVSSERARPVTDLFPEHPEARHLRLLYLTRISSSDHNMALLGASGTQSLSAQPSKSSATQTHAEEANERSVCGYQPASLCALNYSVARARVSIGNRRSDAVETGGEPGTRRPASNGCMEKRDLGSSQIGVSELCFGGNVFGWTADEATSFRLLDNFFDVGGNFIDTADVYSRWVEGHHGGESETIVGKWLKQTRKRNQVILTTKVGMDMGEDRKGLSKAHIARSIDESLRRLQTDYVDVYLSHEDDSKTPLEETLGAYADLIQAGKVRVIGASNYSADRLAEALRVSEEHRLPRYQVLQPEYHLANRDFESQLQPLCDEKNIAVTPYRAIASGFLTGKYRLEADLKNKARGNSVKKYLNDRGFRILDALDEVANRHHVKPAQIAVAWLLTRRTVASAIASATTLDQLSDLVSAAELKLELADVELLTHASSAGVATSA